MAKTSRASKASSSKTRSSLVDEPVSIKASTTHKRGAKAAQSIPFNEPSSPPTPYQLQAIPGVNPQQYPHVQFVHLPYSYPYVLQAAVPHQSRPAPPPQPHSQAHSRLSPPSQPQPSSSSPTPTQPPTLESVFRETLQKLHDLEATLSNTQAVTKHALVRHQYELQKWKTHCMAFKQERDAARETIKSLMEERARLLNRQPNVPVEMIPAASVPSTSSQPTPGEAKEEPREVQVPSPPLASIQTDLASEKRKATRTSRRHSPYSSPTASPRRRLSSASDIPTYNCARWDPSIYPILPGARASSSPPSLSGPAEPSPPTLLDPIDSSRQPVDPAIDERLKGLEFACFDPIRQEGDDTAFDVTWVPSSEPMELEYPLSRSPSAVRVQPGEDSGSDMELESDEEEVVPSPELSGSTSRPAPCKPSGPPTKSTVDIDHIDLLFTPAGGRIWCRLCMLEHSNRAAQLQSKDTAADVDPCLTNFKPNESWPELRDHWSAAHPTESERLAGLNYEELSRLRDSRAVPPVIQS
ncbi:hypothetical protein FA13DRAFT_1412195 [Coprinellus micaceus]|uniref:Uncharacterized protein n=1 Tax=Coprinellus micaceus TaxID=71717 RepID=A0A4Y7SQK2_COPMI|nr:hypothetical protein FA13DRAFT_1412195 [Coprinellus micaceus]